jgi:hypothetical protein
MIENGYVLNIETEKWEKENKEVRKCLKSLSGSLQ